MDKAPTFVGIDVSKRRLDIHSRPSGESFTVDHDEQGVAALVERLAALAPTLVVLEVRLAQALFRPGGKVRHRCPRCGLQRHDADAVHCNTGHAKS